MAQSMPATCGECYRVCKSKNALKEHRRYHNKKYVCYDGQCGLKEPPVAFATKRDLNRHQRTHAAHPKIQCHYCHAVVGRIDNLKRHIDTIHKGGICTAAASGDEEAVMSCLVVDTKFAREKDPSGDLALFLAVSNGHEGVVRILLDTGFQVETECPVDDPRPTALWLARVHERHDIANLLVGGGAVINLRNGTRPEVFVQAAKERNLQLLRRCLQTGVTMNYTDWRGRTALHWAVNNRDEEMTKLLIANGAVVNHTSVLIAAAEWGHLGIFSTLLEKTRELGAHTFCEMLLDSKLQHEDILQLVVQKWLEIDKNCRLRRSWETVVYRAVGQGCEAAVRVLFDNGASITSCSLQGAAGGGYLEVVRVLLDRGAEIDAVNWMTGIALHRAVSGRHLEVVRLLLDRGAEIHTVSREGRTALHYAAFEGCTEVVRLLLDRGAEIDAVDREGRTALHYAAFEGCTGVVRLLLDRGAEIDAVDREGRTALHLGVYPKFRRVNVTCIRLLLERGADRQARDKMGETFTARQEAES